jgi:hypothetical protein
MCIKYININNTFELVPLFFQFSTYENAPAYPHVAYMSEVTGGSPLSGA